VHGWKDRWSNGGPAPQLFLRKHEDENVIYDSRSGQSVEYAIPHVTAKMLHSMEVKPKDLVDLSREFATVSEFDVTKEMAFLQEKGLVFEEKERYLSVALIAKNGANRPRFKL
jgi:hypothetical protein